jgi:phosphatidylserine/phosphatidylglycerophosphate/cardiolipin synthase-like enzyme
MHHKYVVRDGHTVWTGSTNWTDDSWSREENVIIVVESEAVGASYQRDFEELWSTQTVAGSGGFDPEPDTVAGARVQPWFSPGRGERVAHRISTAFGRAERRIRIASPVLTSGPILGTLAEVTAGGVVDVAGVVDGTQMNEVHGQWLADNRATWKIPALTSVLSRAPFAGKVSTPYGPGTVHDYMHAKIAVADHIVFVGSYNLSHSGEENAENVLEIADPDLADRMAIFVDEIRARYPAFGASELASPRRNSEQEGNT